MTELNAELERRRVYLTGHWPGSGSRNEPGSRPEDHFAVLLPTLMLATKADLIPDLDEEIAVFRELTGLDYPALAVSVETGQGLERIGPWLLSELAIVRVYTKAPGRAPAQDRPFTLSRGATVEDVARLVAQRRRGGTQIRPPLAERERQLLSGRARLSGGGW